MRVPFWRICFLHAGNKIEHLALSDNNVNELCKLYINFIPYIHWRHQKSPPQTGATVFPSNIAPPLGIKKHIITCLKSTLYPLIMTHFDR